MKKKVLFPAFIIAISMLPLINSCGESAPKQEDSISEATESTPDTVTTAPVTVESTPDTIQTAPAVKAPIIKTADPAPKTAAEPVKKAIAKPATVSTEDISEGKALLAKSDCFACHKDDTKLVGPAYADVAKKYSKTEATYSNLVGKIIEGGAGVWGEVPMSPHPTLSRSDAKKMVHYIMSLK